MKTHLDIIKSILFSVLLALSFTTNAQVWQFEGSRNLSGAEANYPEIISDVSGKPYVLFNDKQYADKATVMTFDGTNWTAVGARGFSTLGVTQNGSILKDNSGNLWVTLESFYQDANLYTKYLLEVWKYDGTSWQEVGPQKEPNGALPKMAISGGDIYLTFNETYANGGGGISLMKYNGSTWQYVGASNFTPYTHSVQDLAILNGVPYISILESVNSTTKLVVMKFDGTSWQYVGQQGISTASGGGYVNWVKLKSNASGVPYICYVENPSNGVNVMTFNGTNWVQVGAVNLTTAFWVDLDFDGDVPYIGFQDLTSTSRASVMKFNGSTWEYVGQQGFTPTAAYAENIDIKNGVIRVAYTEGSSARGLSVMRYNTLAKPEINITGNGNNILKGATTTSAANGTNLGQAGMGSSTKKTYTIQNTDEGTLNISSIVTSNTLFVISGAPTTVAANSSATFDVTFTPTALGVQNATITVNNNDADEGVYDFAVTAEGVAALAGAALSINGSNRQIVVPDNSSLDISAAMTVEAWCNWSSLSGYQVVVLKATSGSWGGGYGLTTYNGVIYAHLAGWGYSHNTGYTVPINQWVHVAATFDGTTSNVYINGVLIATKAITATIPTNNLNLGIGCDIGSGYTFSGKLDEVRIWNRALTLSDIQTNMNCEIPTTRAGLVANYHFNQGISEGNNTSPAVNTLVDASGFGNNGALNNFTLTGTTANWVAPGGVVSGTNCAPPPVDPDYVVSNVAGALIITDRVGNSDVLEVTQNGTNINFNAVGRTYALNGGATTAMPVDIAKSGLTSIVINTEGGNDTIKFSNYITAMPSLTVNGGAGDDVVYSIGGGITFLPNANLDLDLTNDASTGDKDEVVLEPLSNDILSFFTLSGTGTATVKVSKSVYLGTRCSITTQQGDITVEGNWAGTTSGNFTGVTVGFLGKIGINTFNNPATGQVTVRGKGGDTGDNNHGVQIASSGGVISGGTTGTALIKGMGGISSGNNNYGVLVATGGSSITSGGSNVVVEGNGGGVGTSSGNAGVLVWASANMYAGGSGTLTVTGIGGGSSGINNHGVQIIGGIGSQFSGGDVVINGTKGANSAAVDVVVTNTGGITGKHNITVNSLIGGFFPNNVSNSFSNASTTKATTFATGSKFNYYVGGPTRAGATAGQHFPLQLVGLIDLNSVELVTSGGYIPRLGNEFLVVINDGTDPVIGKFKYKGVVLNQGDQLLNFNGSTVPFYINYNGGTGNDVVIAATNIILGTPSVTHVNCYNGDDGRVTLSSTGGTGAVSYAISPNIGTQISNGTFTGLTAQTYTFTASDANSNTKTVTVTVTEPTSLPLIYPTATATSCEGVVDGKIVVAGAGGTGALTYTLNPSTSVQSPSGTFTGLAAQSYMVIARDANNCEVTKTVTVSSGASPSLSWGQIIKKVASDRKVDALFGHSVAISGNYAVVGANGDDTDVAGANILNAAGSAYIFRLVGTNWVQEAKIVASDRAADDNFGLSVSIHGDYVIVGAFNDDGGRGSAYIFKRSGTTWIQEKKIVASDRAADDRFGLSVSIHGDYVIAGAYNDDVFQGSAYVFKRTGTNWTQESKIVSPVRSGEAFGISAAISSEYAIVGAYFNAENADGSNFMFSSGAAYIFKRTGTTWVLQTKAVAADRSREAHFGVSVALDGDNAIIGADYDDNDVTGRGYSENAGSAYIFKRNGTTWVQESKIVSSDRARIDFFGHSVSISGNYAIVGAGGQKLDASGANSLFDAGAAYIFKRTGNTWMQDKKVAAPDRDTPDQFGFAVAMNGDYALVGAHLENEDVANANTLNDAGSVYFVSRTILTFSTPSVTNTCVVGAGKIVLSTTGGTGTVAYMISPNIGTQSPAGTFNGLTTQTYTITASDANCNVKSINVTVEGCESMGNTIAGAIIEEGNSFVASRAKEGGEFALYQNQPNPATNGTTIGFNLPKDSKAILTIMAFDGRVVRVFKGQYKAGYNAITVNRSDLNTSGVFYYRLETKDHSASKKMVIID